MLDKDDLAIRIRDINFNDEHGFDQLKYILANALALQDRTTRYACVDALQNYAGRTGKSSLSFSEATSIVHNAKGV